jgi:hypothetical protein
LLLQATVALPLCSYQQLRNADVGDINVGELTGLKPEPADREGVGEGCRRDVDVDAPIELGYGFSATSLPVALPIGEQLEDRPLQVRGSRPYFPHPPVPVAAYLVADAERASCFQAHHQPVRHGTLVAGHEAQVL